MTECYSRCERSEKPSIDLTKFKVNTEALQKFMSIEGAEREFSLEERISPLAFDMRTLSESSLLNKDGGGDSNRWFRGVLQA